VYSAFRGSAILVTSRRQVESSPKVAPRENLRFFGVVLKETLLCLPILEKRRRKRKKKMCNKEMMKNVCRINVKKQTKNNLPQCLFRKIERCCIPVFREVSCAESCVIEGVLSLSSVLALGPRKKTCHFISSPLQKRFYVIPVSIPKVEKQKRYTNHKHTSKYTNCSSDAYLRCLSCHHRHQSNCHCSQRDRWTVINGIVCNEINCETVASALTHKGIYFKE